MTTLTLPREQVRPASNVVTRTARRLLFQRLEGLQEGLLEIRDGDLSRTFGRPAPDGLRARIDVHDPILWKRVMFSGTSGAGESFARGEWAADDLTAVIRLLVRNLPVAVELSAGWANLLKPWRRIQHRMRRNTKAGSRRNIHAHYDLGNDFFRLFLDRTLSYSSGIYPSPTATLEEAQVTKLDRLCQKLALTPDDHLLEIGTGWGGLAVHAAQHYGCRVTTTTISRRQFEEAKRRVAAAGLAERVTLLERDYRDLEGQYDKLVSVEMIEAVGADHFETFFAACSRLLKPEGQALIQAITIKDQEYERALGGVDFIQRWIFPGSCIPSVTALTGAATSASDLRLTHLEDFGPHYARTLADWRDRFLARTDEVRALGYPDTLIRLWDFYLAYCEGGFEERNLGLAHLLFSRPRSRQEVLMPTFGEAPRRVGVPS